MTEDFDTQLKRYFDTKDEKLHTFIGSCEKDNEPDYELLKRHLEMWVARNPEAAKNFLDYKKETLATNFKDTGANKDNSIRMSAGIPRGLYQLFSVLSPNFMGQKELTPKSRTKKTREFLKHFPIFKTVKSL